MRDPLYEALDIQDARQIEIRVAGPSALLVAKLHKLADRAQESGGKRVKEKDALDVLRLLRGVPIEKLAEGVHRLRAEPLSAAVTAEAIQHFDAFFSTAQAPGSQLAVRATEGLEDPVEIGKSCEALAGELLAAIG